MKSDVMHSKVQMEPSILERLIVEVKETLATDVELKKTSKPAFGAVDLWKLRKGRRTAAGFRKAPAFVTGLSY